MLAEKRIAIVHDGLAGNGEVARVVEEIAGLLPQADVLAAAGKAQPAMRTVGGRTVERSRMPTKRGFRRPSGMLSPFAMRGLDLSSYDIVITSCAGAAKAAGCSDDAVHVCYCYGPTRAIWRYREYARTEMVNPAAGLLLLPVRAGLRRMDAALSLQPDYYVATCRAAAEEIRRCYGRRALVIHPPVDVSGYHRSAADEDYYVLVSPLVAHKRIDAVIAACNSTGSRLLIVGDGPDRRHLEALAGPTVKVVGSQAESEAAELIARCIAVFCFDAEEEFDGMPLKANAAGRPAIALATDTAQETIVDRETGILYEEYSRPAIVEAMKECRARDWNGDVLRKYSRTFDGAAFRSQFAAFLDDILGTEFVQWATA